MQHRLIWYLTRLCVPTSKLDEAFSRYYEEADIVEEWVDIAVLQGGDITSAELVADEALSEIAESGVTFRELLADPQKRAFVRTSLRHSAKQRYAAVQASRN